MKYSKYLVSLLVTGIIILSCSKSFLDVPVSGLGESQVANRSGVENLLIGAYAMLDGVTGTDQKWVKGGAISNWVFGSICGSDAYKGSDAGDEGENITPLETFMPAANNLYLSQKWNAVYTGVYRTNDVLRLSRMAKDISPAEENEIEAEARFLRAFYHFEAKKMWNKVPFVDETVSFANNNYHLSNTRDIWPEIDNDLRFAIANLPATQQQVGRASRYAAYALLAKSYMFQDSFYKAKKILDTVIGSGNYKLNVNYTDNFNAAKDNSAESVFACQSSVNDFASGMNGDYGDNLNNANYGSGEGCCGFFQPSQYLVNHFKTDAVTGLPDFAHFNDVPVKNDDGIQSSDPFIPYGGTLDPRLDLTVGRRGIPFLDWGIHTGQDWIKDQQYGGPYSPKKNAYYKSQEGILTEPAAWPVGIANNINLIRYSDVLLWAAEADIELGNLDEAQFYVNLIRNRMADHHEAWVHKYLDDSDPQKGSYTDDAHLAANYYIKPYLEGDFTAHGQDYARKAVRYERTLELGMEGHRFFDLVRWGTASTEINAYLQKERTLRYYLTGTEFIPNHNEYFPIPQTEIDKSAGAMTQNPGY